MKTLISWLAFNNDFKDGKVDTENSPNFKCIKFSGNSTGMFCFVLQKKMI